MSRCSDLVRVLAVALGLAVTWPTIAHAETINPTPLPTPDEYRTAPLTERSFALTPVTQDLAGVAQSAIATRRIDVRIDANVAFAKDSARIRPQARARLSEVARALASAPPGKLTITGHTDDLGSAEHGTILSRQRAEAVRTALGTALDRHDVQVAGRGEDQPLVENRDETSRARNRRVELGYRAT